MTMIKRVFNWMLMASLTMGLGWSVTACSSDDDDDNKTNPGEEVATSDSDPYGKNTNDGVMAYTLLSQLSCIGDSLPNDWKTASFEVQDGLVTDPSQPLMRKVVVDDINAALDYYNELTSKSLTSAVEDVTTIADCGTVKFNPVNQSDCFATIDVDVKQLKKLNEIRLVPSKALGLNAAFEGKPYYRLGDVVQDKEGCYWICVRPCHQKTSVDQSFWVSFNIGNGLIKTVSFKGLLKQPGVPFSLGNKKKSVLFATQLLASLSRPDDFKKVVGSGNFGEAGKGFAELPVDAMPNDDFLKVVENWDKYDLWNKVKPSGMSASDFKKFFTGDLTMIYNQYREMKPTLRLDLERLSNASNLYRTTASQKDATADFDMQKETVDITSYSKSGTGNYNKIGNQALVIRYKDGKGLSNVKTSGQNVSPTERIASVKDIYCFNKN